MKTLTYLALLCLILTECTYQPSNVSQSLTDLNTHKDSLNRQKRQTDSLIVLIKKDSLFEIKDAYFDTHTGTLKIAFSNKYNVLREKNYTTKYFENTYHTPNYDYIDGISLCLQKEKAFKY